jgi:hypothetical protein
MIGKLKHCVICQAREIEREGRDRFGRGYALRDDCFARVEAESRNPLPPIPDDPLIRGCIAQMLAQAHTENMALPPPGTTVH